jgi:hypothetical protein
MIEASTKSTAISGHIPFDLSGIVHKT